MTAKTKDGVTTTYTYDLAGQLASESRSGYLATYTYDGNGNRLSKTLNGTTENYSYDDGDKMLTAGAKSYGYDVAGRTTSVTDGSSVTSLNYDYESRLTSLSGATSASYTYNGLNTRVSKIKGGATTDFVRDGIGVTAPVIRDSNAAYTPGVSEHRGSNSTWNFSGLKNAETQVSSSGTPAATKTYDAFGNAVSSTGTWSGPFGYAGDYGYQEDASGLKLLGHRYYDSSTGRFLTRDPAKDGRNWYEYCGNNPIGYCDPDGLKMADIWGKVVDGGKWIVDKLETGTRWTVGGIAKVVGTVLLVGPISKIFESMYEGAIGAGHRREMDDYYNKLHLQGAITDEQWINIKKRNGDDAIDDAVGLMGKYWEAQKVFWRV